MEEETGVEVSRLLNSIKSSNDSLDFMKDVSENTLVPCFGLFLEEVNCLGKAYLGIENFINNVMEIRMITLHVLNFEGFVCGVKRRVSHVEKYEAVVRLGPR